jgi:hypothetical protein
MTIPEPGKRWRKSSASNPDGECVEIEEGLGAVRDSKNPESVLAGVNVRALVAAVRSGQIG